MRVDEKQELCLYLSEQFTLIGTDHEEVASAKRDKIVFKKPQIYYLAPMKKLRAADAARRKHTNVMVRTGYMDAIVTAVVKFQYFFLSKLWIDFGLGKHLKYLPAQDMFHSIDEEKSQDLAFHAFAGYDQTSSFVQYGKNGKHGAQCNM